VAADEEIVEFDIRTRHASGDFLWLNSRNVIFTRGDDGRTVQIIGSMQDVTAAREAMESLKAGEERFSLLMQTMKDGLVIQDEKGLISFANDKFCRLVGCSVRDLAGKRLPDYIAGPWNDMQGKAGGAGKAEAVSFEATAQGRDSEDVRLEMTTRELVDEDGRLKGSFSVITDITELRQLRERIQLKDGFEGMVGRDVLMLDLFKTVREASTCDYPVLIQGESGTGKELAAVAVHNLSSRSGRQFVPVNCGALADNLIESELFGHLRGAFTGAIRDKKGRLEIAHRGTLFLDEIGDLSLALQVKFLRFLQEGTFERLGDEKTTRVDVRVISATNKDLKEEVAKGRFREDLFFRLSTFPVTVPALRERPADIPLLTEHIVMRTAEKMRLESVEVLPEARALLTAHLWPGNIRELENVLTYALIKSRKGAIDIHHLPESVSVKTAELLIPKGRRRKVSAEAVSAALAKTGGNMSAAARMLGISRATLYRIFGRHT
jgi:PAS domain S-box-containing protein